MTYPPGEDARSDALAGGRCALCGILGLLLKVDLWLKTDLFGGQQPDRVEQLPGDQVCLRSVSLTSGLILLSFDLVIFC
jgi:hypothetical protein